MEIVKSIKFELETYGQNKIIDSLLRVYKIYSDDKGNETIKEVKSIIDEDEDYFRVQDIFSGTLCKTPKVELECRYDDNDDIDIFLVTPAADTAVSAVESRLGWNRFPVNPNDKDLTKLKNAIESVDSKLREVKAEYTVYNKETFCLKY